MQTLRSVLVVFFAAVMVTGCDAALDCHAICSRYSDCFDKSYDVGACESRCRTHSSDDANYRNQADQCSACIDDRACSSTAFNCGSQCSNVVP